MTSPISHMSEVDLAWLAGLLEGEGSFSIDRRGQQRYQHSTVPPAPFIALSMTDEDVVVRVAALLGKKVCRVSRHTVTQKTVYKVSVGDRATLQSLLPRLLPYMGQRRRARIEECLTLLAAWEDWKQSKDALPEAGHRQITDRLQRGSSKDGKTQKKRKGKKGD